MNQIDRELAANPEQLRELFSAPIQYGDQLRFLLDSNADHHLVGVLAGAGIDVTTAQSEDIHDWKSDFRVLQYATVRGRVLITRDKDFRQINEAIMGIEGATHAGIIFMKTNTARRDPALTANFIIDCVDAGAPSGLFQGTLVGLSSETKYTDYI